MVPESGFKLVFQVVLATMADSRTAGVFMRARQFVKKFDNWRPIRFQRSHSEACAVGFVELIRLAWSLRF